MHFIFKINVNSLVTENCVILNVVELKQIGVPDYNTSERDRSTKLRVKDHPISL